MLTVLLLFVSIVTRERPARWRLLPGIVLGLLIATHQRGAVVGVGVGVWMVVDRLLLVRDGSLLATAAWFAAGASLVLVPLTVYLVATAGVGPVWQALVLHPLLHYRARVFCPWGCTGLIGGLFSFPTVLKYSPLVLAVPIFRLATSARAGNSTDSRS